MQFYSTLLLSLLSATAHAGSIVGGFEVIGTICYPPDQKGEDLASPLTIETISKNNGGGGNYGGGGTIKTD